MDGTGRAGVATPGEAEIFAVHFAEDGAAGVEDAGDDGGVGVGDVAFQRRGTVHHRYAGEADIVLQRNGLAGELAAGRAFDRGLDVPGVIFVLLTFGAITGRPRIFHRRNIIRHGVDDVIGGVISLHQGVVGSELRLAHLP